MGCFSAGGGGTTETKTEAQKKGLAKALEEYLPTLGKGADIFPESRVTPFSTLQQKSITGVGQFADYFSEPQQVGTPLFKETGTAIKDLLAGKLGAKDFEGATAADLIGATDFKGATAADMVGATDIKGAKTLSAQDVEDYFGRAIYEPTMKTLREDVVPGISEAYAGPGFWGSARSHEEVETRKDTADWLGTQRAGLEWDVLGRNQAIAEAEATRKFARDEALADRRVAAAEAKAGRKLTAEEALAIRRTAVAEAEAGRRFAAGEGAAGRALAAVPGAMAYGQVPSVEIKNNLEIAAGKIGGLNQIFGFGQAEQTQAQMELQDEIMRFAEENQITDEEDLFTLLTLLGQSFTTTQGGTGPGLGYSMLSGATAGFAGGFGQGYGSTF